MMTDPRPADVVDAFELHVRLNRIRQLVVQEITRFGGRDLPELLSAERKLAAAFERACAA